MLNREPNTPPEQRPAADAAGPAPQAAPAGKPAAPSLPHAVIMQIVAGIALAMFLGALDQTIVATALPTIGRHFGNIDDLPWVVTVYLLTGTATTPLLGKLSDIHGRRMVMLGAISVFIIGSIACALAPSMMALIIARGLQGLGGGGLIALAQTIIADIVTPRERGRYQGYISAVFAVSSVGGPVLGGFLTEHLDWSLIFWINLPLGAAALAMCWRVLKLVPFHKRDHRLDVVGALLMMGASVALLLALSWGGRLYPWASREIVALFALSLVLWLAFAWRLKTAAEPFLPLAVLGNKVVRAAALAGACNMATLIGMTIFVPLYFEVVLHLSATQSGLGLIPMMTAVVLAATLTGRSLMRVERYKRIPMTGTLCGIAALTPLAIAPAGLPLPVVILLQTVIGLSIGTVFPISTVCMQNAVERSQMGVATGAANFFRALFSSLVVAILGAIVLGGLGGTAGMEMEMLARSASAPALEYAFRLVFIACALVLALGFVFLIILEERPLRGPGTPPPAIEH